MSNVTHILYADGLRRGRVVLSHFLAPAPGSLEITEVSSLTELKEALRDKACDVVVAELDLPGCDGLDLVDAVQAERPALPLVVLTSDTDRALEAMHRGVADTLSKTPRQLARLPHILRRVLEAQRLEREKRRVEERLRMVTRARTVMAECNRVLIRATDEDQLLRDMCRIVVDSGGYRTAWVGLVRHDAGRTIEPVASAGVHVDHLASTTISWGTDESGQGPSGSAVRSRKPQATRHIQTDPRFSSWRQLVVEHGFEAAASLPLISGDAVLGILGILAAEPAAFDGGELALLEELAHDIAYGLSNLRLRATQRRADELLRLEHAVTRCLAEGDSVTSALSAAIRVICKAQDWECGRYFHADEAADVLRFAAAWHVAEPAFERFVERSREVVFGHGDGLVGRVWDSGEPMWSPDIRSDARTLKKSHSVDLGVRAAFDVPVTAGGRTIGVLIFSSRAVREPDDRLLRSVQVIGSQIGQFLQRREAEEKIRGQALQQRLIAEFGQQALANEVIDDVLTRAMTLVADTLAADYAAVLELAPDGSEVVYRAVSGWPQEWVGSRTVALEPGSRANHCLERGEPFISEDYSDSRFLASRLVQHGVRSGAHIPIFGARGAYGLLNVHTRQLRRFTEDDLSFLRSIANILAIAVERKNAEDRLAHLAQFDTVTGLPNRHLLRDRLGHALTRARRSERGVAMLFIDLDRFKAVNDTYGHAVGDALLRQVGSRISECVRGGDTVARISGDEFAVVLSGLTKGNDAGLVAQKVVHALAAPFELDGHQAYISASIGISFYPDDGDEVDTLLRNADTAMYRAKQQGRNGYQFYLPEMNERLMERLQLEAKLRGALERGEFRLHFQPKVSLETGAISGFEALLRWQHGERLVSPADFIPILEDTGLIVPAGEWVLRSVCEQIREWQDRGIAAPRVAVNLSTRQFQHKNLALMVAQNLRETGVAPDLLELELTESLLMSDAEEAAGMLRELKSLGVRLAIDDFGTGYSSLAYLKRFPLDTLKIDRAFIRDTVTDPDDATLTLTIINLAHSMRLKVVAEGVETQDQVDFLRRNGCDEMQGYYFARPMPAAECLRMLVEDREIANATAKSAIRLLRLQAGANKAAA